MTTKTTKKPLRFAALCRVSTEAQEKTGESLNTQRKANDADAVKNGGKVAAWYGGQEHATPGWEKKELQRLLTDAAQGKFDAVIVNNADRWSRDNTKSKEGLELFRQHGIRFFVGTTEYNLFDPTHCLFLGMSAEIGQFLASNQSKKSLENRIERARQGMPACGKLPFGRTWDPKTKWGIDAEKKALIRDVAKRYLKGQAVLDLAREYGMNPGYLHMVLTQRCGTVWTQHFACKELNISEEVPTTVPALLDEATITAIAQRIEANKTYDRSAPAKYQYLLRRFVFCTTCGGALFGATRINGKSRTAHYRHRQQKRYCQ